MELEGRFTSADNLAKILKDLGAERMSGTLVLRCGTAVAEFDFHQGKFSGSENSERPRQLGHILLSRGLIDRAALEEALAYQADFSPETPIGRVLLHRKRLTQPELRDTIRLQLEEEIVDILSQGEGFYQFKPAEPSDNARPLVELEPESVVREALRRHADWEKIRVRISNENLIPTVVKLKDASDREMLHLHKNEWHVLSLINGYYDVGCIAARSGLGRFETYKILDTFLTTCLIELKPTREPVPAHLPDSPEQSESGNGSSAGTSSTRWGSILARLRDEPDQDGDLDLSRLQFDSPVAFLAMVGNRILDRLMTNPDFIVDPSDERLAERYWRQILMSHPRADLVSADLNALNSDNFDRYMRSLGIEGLLKSIYLETMEAVTRYLRTLYLLSAQRLGSRMARSLFVDVMESVKQRSSIGNSDSFFFKEVAARILE